MYNKRVMNIHAKPIGEDSCGVSAESRGGDAHADHFAGRWLSLADNGKSLNLVNYMFFFLFVLVTIDNLLLALHVHVDLLVYGRP